MGTQSKNRRGLWKKEQPTLTKAEAEAIQANKGKGLMDAAEERLKTRPRAEERKSAERVLITQVNLYLERVFEKLEIETAEGHMARGFEAALEVARINGWKYPNLKKVMDKWDELQKGSNYDPVVNPVTLELACREAGVGLEQFVSDLTGATFWFGMNKAKTHMAWELPRLVEQVSENMKLEGKKGLGDRQLMAKMGGLVQEAPSVIVNNSNTVKAGVQVGLPNFEMGDKLVEDLGYVEVGQAELEAGDAGGNLLEPHREGMEVEDGTVQNRSPVSK